jgi:hypothetical protein
VDKITCLTSEGRQLLISPLTPHRLKLNTEFGSYSGQGGRGRRNGGSDSLGFIRFVSELN